MNKYKKDDKVETPFGVGTIINYDSRAYKVAISKKNIFRYADFLESDLQPYKSAHQKLLDLGYKVVFENNNEIEYENYNDTNRGVLIIIKRSKKCEYGGFIDVGLSKIIMQYLEEVEPGNKHYLEEGLSAMLISLKELENE